MEETNVKRIICPYCDKSITGLYLSFCPNCGKALKSTDFMQMKSDTLNVGTAKEKSIFGDKTNIIKDVGIFCIVAVVVFLIAGIHNLVLSNDKELAISEPDKIKEQTLEAKDYSSENNVNSSEYVKTICIYAEQGAVVTWYDSKTGEFKFKPKCEGCGQVVNSERHIYQGLTNSMSSYTSSFSCTNPNCSMRGKSQKIVIGCEASGEWVN